MNPKFPIAVMLCSIALASVPAPVSAQVVPDNTAKEEPVFLSIFQVTGEKDEGYRSVQTISGSRTLADLRDTPPSISVLNRELLDDLMATNLAYAMSFGISGELSTDTDGNPNDRFVIRGILSNLRLRNGVTWYGGASDLYNIERVELLRGPHAFLYGEGTVTGLTNQITKQATYHDFEKMNIIFGSHHLYRIEFDVNRRVGDKFALRTAIAYGNEGTVQHHSDRTFQGAYLTANWRPFKNTNINADAEYRHNAGTMASNTLADSFSITDRTGATQNLTATTGGRTFLPALGINFDSAAAPARRRSIGTGIVLMDESVLPREYNFLGPNAPNDSNEIAFGLHLDQKVSENFNVQASLTYVNVDKWYFNRVGASAGGIYRDINPTLPNGMANPYFNELYTEYRNRVTDNNQPVRNARLTAVYEWKLPFTTQKIMGTAVYHDADPSDYRYSEFVDPASGNFKGTYNAANTLAAYTANAAVANQNFFHRRFYLKDGDGSNITAGGAIPGQSIIQRDIQADGAGGRMANRLYRVPGVSIGADGSYFGGRLHTLIGYRHTEFKQDTRLDYYNIVTGETFIPSATPTVKTRISAPTVNYGAVLYLSKMVGIYFNAGDTSSLSSGFGPAMIAPGAVRGPLAGEGHEYGLRWSFMDGRLESNWLYYSNIATHNNADPAIPAEVRVNELGSIFGAEINSNGGDTQSSRTTGFEFETVANLTKNWRMTWNLGTCDLATWDRYPFLRMYQARAKAQNIPTPETDAFLASVPTGTPLPGFTRLRSNVVTMYRFIDGPLKNFSVGGSVQLRAKSYMGNFDLDADGVAEQLWSSGYDLWNLMMGYRAKIMKKTVNFSLNVNNLFDRDYFRSNSLASGRWGDGRNLRFATRVDF
jgi:outer membrane receptor for ferric coprogen and ferric-rhodotorulic acid